MGNLIRRDSTPNWFLTNAKVENGYTMLEFYRNLTSCDIDDLDIVVCIVTLFLFCSMHPLLIQAEPMQIYYVWSNDKPSSSDILSATSDSGFAVLNLIGRLNPSGNSTSSEEEMLFVGVENVSD